MGGVRAMENPRTTWTDERLDDLSGRITRLDNRLTGKIAELDDRLTSRIDRLEERVDSGFDKIDASLHEIQRSMLSLQRKVIGALVVIASILASGHL
jgi:chromosome segregation ATPase